MKLPGDTRAELWSLFLRIEEIHRYVHQQGREYSYKFLQPVACLTLIKDKKETPKFANWKSHLSEYRLNFHCKTEKLVAKKKGGLS